MSDGVTLATTPSFITFSYPTVTIGTMAAGSMGTTPQSVYSFKVGGIINMSGSVQQISLLTITINNECFSTTLSASLIGDSYTY